MNKNVAGGWVGRFPRPARTVPPDLSFRPADGGEKAAAAAPCLRERRRATARSSVPRPAGRVRIRRAPARQEGATVRARLWSHRQPELVCARAGKWARRVRATGWAGRHGERRRVRHKGSTKRDSQVGTVKGWTGVAARARGRAKDCVRPAAGRSRRTQARARSRSRACASARGQQPLSGLRRQRHLGV